MEHLGNWDVVWPIRDVSHCWNRTQAKRKLRSLDFDDAFIGGGTTNKLQLRCFCWKRHFRKKHHESTWWIYETRIYDWLKVAIPYTCWRCNIYIYVPGTQMTSIFKGQPPKTRPFPIKTRVICVPGIYIYIYLFCTQPTFQCWIYELWHRPSRCCEATGRDWP